MAISLTLSKRARPSNQKLLGFLVPAAALHQHISVKIPSLWLQTIPNASEEGEKTLSTCSHKRGNFLSGPLRQPAKSSRMKKNKHPLLCTTTCRLQSAPKWRGRTPFSVILSSPWTYPNLFSFFHNQASSKQTPWIASGSKQKSCTVSIGEKQHIRWTYCH